jgi:hypothetical protein
MSKRLDETLGTVGYDNLINGLYPPAEPFSVVIRKGSAETTYKRGTVLALSGGDIGDGKYVILGTTPATSGEEPEIKTETLTANAILAEDITVGTTNDETAVAYRTGHFNSNALIMDEEHTFSAADKEALRSVGILISDAVEI